MNKLKKLINKQKNELNDKEKLILFILDILIIPIILIIASIPALFLWVLASYLFGQI